MERKTIVKLCVSAAIVILSALLAFGVIGGKDATYQIPGPYTAESTNDFSTVKVEMMIAGDKITDVEITSSGDTDLLNDDIRAEWAASILEHQSADNDVISGATLTYSAGSVKEAVDDILVQAGLKEEAAEPEPAEEAEESESEGEASEAEAEASGEAAYSDGEYSVTKTTDFSTIDVGITVEGGAITGATVTSEGANDLLTDENRDGWAAQIVEKQSVDAVSGVTISSTAVAEAVDELLAQAAGGNGEAAYNDGEYSVTKTTDFSTIDVGITVEDGAITAATVTSEGANDLLTDENRDGWAAQIVEKQSVDAVSGVTISSTAVAEAVDELLAQAAGGDGEAGDGKVAELEAAVQEAEARIAELEAAASAAESKLAEAEAKVAELEAASAEPEAAAEAADDAEAPAYKDGEYSVTKATDFSTIDVGITVEGGAITGATVTSEGANDLLTDENRDGWTAQIVEKQSVDAVSGATISSTAVQEAVEELLAQAAGDAGEAEEAVEEAENEASGETEAPDAGRLMRDRPALGAVEAEAAEAGETAESSEEDAERLMRDRPALDAVEAEPAETDEAAEGSGEDAERLMRDRPALDAVEAEPAEAGETVEGSGEDAERLMRDKPALGAVEAEPAEAEETEAEPAGAGALADGSYTAESANDFSTITVSATVEGGRITEATVASDGGPTDLLTDDIKAEWSQAIVDAQSADADAITGATLTFSAGSVKEAVDDILAQAGGDIGEPAPEQSADLSKALPYIVTTMGDNRENSYVISYLEQDPYLVNIYEGYGFAKDYGSARGHEYTLEDVSKTQRPHPKANCITCKTPDFHKLVEQEGVGVYSMDFDTVMAQMTNNVSCYTCHGDDMGNGGALVVTHQYVNEALGDNVSAIDPATLSCGQCHIEYYFTPQDSETMMPYHSVEEMSPEAILAYYDGIDFADWTQESTGTRMLKAQHPEMETFLQGKHAALLNCADCHMAPATTDDGVAYHSHYLASPLESEALLETCARCHGDTDMVEFVHGIQDTVTARETEVGNELSAMKDALAEAVASGAWSESDLDAVRKLHREAQWFFDYCYVENSEGAHNSQLSLSCLDTAEAKIEEAMELLEGKAI